MMKKKKRKNRVKKETYYAIRVRFPPDDVRKRGHFPCNSEWFKHPPKYPRVLGMTITEE